LSSLKLCLSFEDCRSGEAEKTWKTDGHAPSSEQEKIVDLYQKVTSRSEFSASIEKDCAHEKLN
jgi:hypothetical protein